MPRAGQSGSILKRYQACHRCRRRKLKCDGETPCANCQKAHVHAITLDPFGTPIEPTCTYDDADMKTLGPKARIASLESENAELRKLLEDANSKLAKCTCGAAQLAFPSELGLDTLNAESASGGGSTLTTHFTASVLQPIQPLSASIVNSTLNPPFEAMSVGDLLVPLESWDMSGAESTPPVWEDIPSGTSQLTTDIWPLNIPPPATLHHLVETFFSSVPLASRLIHKPTFMASLQQAPTSRDFPHVALLHAICAIASIYSPVIRERNFYPQDSGTTRLYNSGIAYRPGAEKGVQGERYFPRRPEDVLGPGPDSFGSMHIQWAGRTMKSATRIGDRLLQLLQAAVIVVWYHYSRGLQIGVYVWLGSISKFVAPLGLNVSEGFEPLSRLPSHTLFLRGKPKSAIEIETIRNVFWCTYVLERLYTGGTLWPMALDDEDVSQLMPCRFSDFMSGVFVPTQGRQHLFTKNMLLQHHSLSTDPWTLYIKATVLISRVRTFNLRYHQKSKQQTPDREARPTENDVFLYLDRTIAAFPEQIPPAYRNPVGTKVDPLLYMAHLLPHVAMIQLHDPHANFSDPNDKSTIRLASAVESILELIYALCSTSFDLIYLDHASSWCWFVTGATIIRFLKAKLNVQDEAEIERLTQELNIVKFVLGNLGDRTVIGLRQSKLLDELYEEEIKTSLDRRWCISER